MSTTGDDPKDLRVSGVSPGERAGASEALDGVSEAPAAAGSEAVDGASAAAGLEEIAQALGAGTLDPDTAKAQLIEQAVAAQVPEGASAELIAEIRAEVTTLLESDPVLERLLQR